MRLLSSRRRHPAAKALLLVFGLFMMGALYTVHCSAGHEVSADTGNSQQIAEGKASLPWVARRVMGSMARVR